MLSSGEITKFLEESSILFQVKGNSEIEVESYSQLSRVSEHKITWVRKWTAKIGEQLNKFNNLIIVCNRNDEITVGKNCYILCDDPKMCFFEILGEFYAKEGSVEQISESAVVETIKIGRGTSVGAFSYIGKEVILGENVQVGAHVTITGKVKIGDGSVVGSGTVLGEPGFGYYMVQNNHRKRVPHLGGVLIGDCVEIGANTCIDCGTMGDTTVGDYTKIDNLCHIGHNVQIGKDVMIVAGTVICGSCEIEDGSYIAPGAVIKNQMRVGRNAFVGMQTAVIRDVKEGESVFGVPGKPLKRDC